MKDNNLRLIRGAENRSGRELVFTKLIRAPRDLVFRAWIEPDHLAGWWGPDGFSVTTIAMNAQRGGSWRFIMHSPDGVDYPNKIIYRDVIRPVKLGYVHGSDEHYDPAGFVVTVTFMEAHGVTELMMVMTFASGEERDRVVEMFGAVEGNKQTMARLEKYIGGL